jgi:hypothetical protein
MGCVGTAAYALQEYQQSGRTRIRRWWRGPARGVSLAAVEAHVQRRWVGAQLGGGGGRGGALHSWMVVSAWRAACTAIYPTRPAWFAEAVVPASNVADVESHTDDWFRLPAAERPREDGLTHPAHTSITNLAAALGLLSSGGFPNPKTLKGGGVGGVGQAMRAGLTCSVGRATSGPNQEPRSPNVVLIGCQSVRQWSSFLPSFRCGQLSVRREAANRVTIDCWYQRRCGAVGVDSRRRVRTCQRPVTCSADCLTNASRSDAAPAAPTSHEAARFHPPHGTRLTSTWCVRLHTCAEPDE